MHPELLQPNLNLNPNPNPKPNVNPLTFTLTPHLGVDVEPKLIEPCHQPLLAKQLAF